MSDLGMTPKRSTSGGLQYGKIIWPIFAVFLVFILARYMQWGARRDLLATIRIEFLTGGIAIIASVLQMTSMQGLTKNSRLIFGAIFALVAIIAIQVPFAANRPLAQIIFNDRVVKFAMLAFLVAVQVRSPNAMRWFVAAFLLSMLYITQESVRGLISGGLVWQNQGIMRLHGAVPMYAHPNSLGGVSASVIPFCVFMFLGVKKWWVRGAMIALAAAAIICVIYSGSRTAYVGVLGFFVGWFLISPNKGRWIGLAAIAAVAGMALLPQEYKERFLSIGGEEAEGQSKATRIEILEDAARVFARYPGGVGVASFPIVRERMFGRRQDTHNLYLEVATNLGIQGLAVFLAFVWLVASSLWRTRNLLHKTLDQLLATRKRCRDRSLIRAIEKEVADVRFLEACSTATFFFLTVRLLVGLFGMDLYEIYWWFAAGMAIALGEISQVLARRCAALSSRTAPVSEEHGDRYPGLDGASSVDAP